MLLGRGVLGAEVAVVLRVCGVLGRGVLLVEWVAVRWLVLAVDRLVWRRGTGRRSHPSGSCERSLAVAAAAARVEASAGG